MTEVVKVTVASSSVMEAVPVSYGAMDWNESVVHKCGHSVMPQMPATMSLASRFTVERIARTWVISSASVTKSIRRIPAILVLLFLFLPHLRHHLKDRQGRDNLLDAYRKQRIKPWASLFPERIKRSKLTGRFIRGNGKL